MYPVQNFEKKLVGATRSSETFSFDELSTNINKNSNIYNKNGNLEKNPGAPRSSQKLPEAPRNSQKLPEAPRSSIISTYI